MLVDVPRLVTAYYTETPDPSVPAQRVAFGTSGHRGCSFDTTFNEWHVLAISQAICLYRERHEITGPLFLGVDTHALSVPALASALEVRATRILAGQRCQGSSAAASSARYITAAHGPRRAVPRFREGGCDTVVGTMAHPPGRNRRRATAALIGLAAATVACFVAYRLMFAAMIGELAKAGETGRVFLILGLVGLVVGSTASSLVLGVLERRARRAHDAARIPRARVER